jgi:hypothetical protein
MAIVQQGEAYIVGFSSGFDATWTFEKIDKKSETTQEVNLGEDNETENITVSNHKYAIDFTAIVHSGGTDDLKSGDIITVGTTKFLAQGITYAESRGKLMVSGSLESYDSMTYT